jgi:hypothetical protein
LHSFLRCWLLLVLLLLRCLLLLLQLLRLILLLLLLWLRSIPSSILTASSLWCRC